MELRHLEQVLEICRAGGFSGAARRLQISQPTLSKSIARLETQLGLKLFERANGAARPTAYGAFVAERAEQLLKGVAALTHDLEQLARGEDGRIRIAVGPATRLKPLPEFLSRVGARFPHLRIEATQETGPGVISALNEGRVDIAFGYSEHAQRYGDLIRKKLFDAPMMFVARAGHPALKLKAAGPDQILRYPVAHASVIPAVEAWAGDMDREQAENLRSFISDDFNLAIQRALETDSLALGAAFLFTEHLQSGRLVLVSTTLEVTYSCWMLTTAERWRSPLIKSLAEVAKAAVADSPLSAAA